MTRAALGLLVGLLLVGRTALAGPLDIPYRADTFDGDRIELVKAGHLSKEDSSALMWHEMYLKKNKGGVPAGWTIARLLVDLNERRERRKQLELDQVRLKQSAIKVTLKRLEAISKGVALEAELENVTPYQVIVYAIEIEVRTKGGEKLVTLSFGSNKTLKPKERRTHASTLDFAPVPELRRKLTGLRVTDVQLGTRTTRLVLMLDE